MKYGLFPVVAFPLGCLRPPITSLTPGEPPHDSIKHSNYILIIEAFVTKASLQLPIVEKCELQSDRK